MKVYTGIGSRQTPTSILLFMTETAKALKDQGYWLRSGHATGADWAFEQGAREQSVIYLPWKSFGQNPYSLDPGRPVLGVPVCDERKWEHFHDQLVYLGIRTYSDTDTITKLQGRNYAQVLGHLPTSPPSNFVLCWCPVVNDQPQGGTATAIKLAQHCNIPVYNLYLPGVKEQVCSLIGTTLSTS